MQIQDYKLNNKTIFKVNESVKKIFVKKSLKDHLYRYLHAFCINEVILQPNFNDYEIEFYDDDYSAKISVSKIKEFMKEYESYITFKDEKQIAVPLCLLDYETTTVRSAGIEIIEFTGLTAKEKWKNWLPRRRKTR